MILAIDVGNTNIVVGCIDDLKTYFILFVDYGIFQKLVFCENFCFETVMLLEFSLLFEEFE